MTGLQKWRRCHLIKNISQSLLENILDKEVPIKLKQTVDWNDDGNYSVIEDDIISATVDIKGEGDLKSVILDSVTTTLNNTDNNYIPNRNDITPWSKTKIYIGDGNEWVEIFSGNITDISPNYNDTKVSLSTGDRLQILKY